MEPRVTIVIATWNRKELLSDCLQSIERQTYARHETVVVDNGSVDGTADMIEASFPWVRLIPSPENRGFCVATNIGLREAGTEFVLPLNNDMTLEPDFLERLIAAADQSEAAMFAPLILWRDEPDVIYSAGDRILVNGRPEGIGFRCLREKFAFPNRIFGVTAGASLFLTEPVFSPTTNSGSSTSEDRTVTVQADLAWKI